MKYYGYKRVSTEKQDIGRQTDALNKWQKENNITIPEENIFTDFYTGKTFNRENYQKLKNLLQKNDYIIVKEVDRLGRNWDGIKKEWQNLKDNEINIIIIDMPILSDPLPHETPLIEGLDLRFIKEQILTLMCYSAQKEREKISQRTKEGLIAKKKMGIKLGRPRAKTNNNTTFKKVLIDIFDNNYSIEKSCYKNRYSVSTFYYDLKNIKKTYNITTTSEIYNLFIKEENLCL